MAIDYCVVYGDGYVISYLSGAARRDSRAPGTRPASLPRKRFSIAARVGRLTYASAKRSRLVPYAARAYRIASRSVSAQRI